MKWVPLAAAVLLALPATAGAHSKPARCVVPRLAGDSLTTARARLEKANCALGPISRPKTDTGALVVVDQSPRAGVRRKRGARVAVTLNAETVASPVTTGETTTANSSGIAATPNLAVTLDPTYTQNPADPFEVTYAVSASATTTAGGITQTVTSLPSGVIEFFSDGQLADSMNVGGAIAGGKVTVFYSSWGLHTTNVVYDSGTNSTTTGTQTETIEPPAPTPIAQTVTNIWPLDTPRIAANVQNAEAAITLTDPDGFGGAASVTITDQLADSCTATVNGTEATCSMPVVGTPTSFDVAFPGVAASTITTTATIATWGVPQEQTTTTTTSWPADSYTIPADDTNVTTPSVTIGWGGCLYGVGDAGWTCSTSTGTVSIPVGDYLNLDAVGIGSLDSSQQAPGYLAFAVTPMTGVTMTDDTGVTASPECDAMSSVPGGAWGDCRIQFADPGTYTVQADYLSGDSNYPDTTGPSLIIDVT